MNLKERMSFLPDKQHGLGKEEGCGKKEKAFHAEQISQAGMEARNNTGNS